MLEFSDKWCQRTGYFQGQSWEFLTMAWDGKPKNIVANEVQKHRMARGWSQEQLAAKCQIAGWDVSRGIIAGIEGRMRCVSDYEVVILANVLGVQLAELYPSKIDWNNLGLENFN